MVGRVALWGVAGALVAWTVYGLVQENRQSRRAGPRRQVCRNE